MNFSSRIDPRTKIFLLAITIIAVFVTFNKNSLIVGIMSGIFVILFMISGLWKELLECGIIYAILTAIEFIVIPNVPTNIGMWFSVFIYFRWLFPCVLPSTYLTKTTKVRSLLEALRLMKLPNNLIISFAVLIRYFPTIKEDFLKIHDAIKLRNIKGFANKFEYFYMPMIMNSMQISDELSASAVTRGIENPNQRTSFTEISLKPLDFVLMTIFLVLVVIGLL